jgi:hypothetical protein
MPRGGVEGPQFDQWWQTIHGGEPDELTSPSAEKGAFAMPKPPINDWATHQSTE